MYLKIKIESWKEIDNENAITIQVATQEMR